MEIHARCKEVRRVFLWFAKLELTETEVGPYLSSMLSFNSHICFTRLSSGASDRPWD